MRGFWAEPGAYTLDNESAVPHEVGNVVVQPVADRVPSVIPYVVDEEVEPVCQPGPQRVIEVRGQAVAVAEENARTVGVSVSSHDDHLAVVHGECHCCGGRRNANHNPLHFTAGRNVGCRAPILRQTWDTGVHSSALRRPKSARSWSEPGISHRNGPPSFTLRITR